MRWKKPVGQQSWQGFGQGNEATAPGEQRVVGMGSSKDKREHLILRTEGKGCVRLIGLILSLQQGLRPPPFICSCIHFTESLIP